MNRSIALLVPLLVLVAGPACSPAPPGSESSAPTAADCMPVLESAWVRAAPPAAPMHAGYAVLRNDCTTPITVVGAESLDYASASIHETLVEDGVSRMREAGRVEVAAHGRLVLEPGGRHLMLMHPARPLVEGDRARARLVLADGRRVFAEFAVRRDAPR